MCRRDAFTLIELLVVIAIILLLVGIIAPSFQPVMEMARQRKCMTNVNKLIKDMRTYSLANESFFPIAYPDVAGSNCVGVDRLRDIKATGANQGAPSKSGPSRSLFLLVKNKYSTVEAFVCPSTDDVSFKTVSLANDYDFTSCKNLSYSYQSQKNSIDETKFFPVTMASDGSLIVLADRNPIIGDDKWSGSDTAGWSWAEVAGGDDVKAGLDKYDKNSFNHGQLGQSCGAADSHVDFQATPNVGARLWKWTDPSDNVAKPAGDNIWTWGNKDTGVPQTGGFIESCPTTGRDSLLK